MTRSILAMVTAVLLTGGAANALPAWRIETGTETTTIRSAITAERVATGTRDSLDQEQIQTTVSGACPEGGCASQVSQRQIIIRQQENYSTLVREATSIDSLRFRSWTDCGIGQYLGL